MLLTRALPPPPLLLSRTGASRCFSTAVPKHQASGANAILAAITPSNNKGAYGQSSTDFKSKVMGRARASLHSEEQLARNTQRAAYQKHIYRRWQPGDVYAPHDLSGAEQNKWRLGRNAPRSDVFETLGINPINEYKNFTMLSEYMSETGRIKHSKQTGLRPKNQRKIAKAIRRAVGLGLMPSVHRHPLVLKSTSPARFW